MCAWECAEPQRLREAILDALSDAPRPGAPAKFTAEQVARIVAVACESPELSGCPIHHWTVRELRDEVLARNIVETISRAQVGRILQQAVLQPHRKKIPARRDDGERPREVPKRGRKRLPDLSGCSQEGGGRRHAYGERGRGDRATSHATALQAIQRNAPDKPVQPGSVTKQEFEYTRHGTTTLTAGLDVVTGLIVSPTLEPTRTEPEFVQHLARTVSADAEGEWIFPARRDCLHTYVSESLVQWVAEQCGLPNELGKKEFVAS